MAEKQDSSCSTDAQYHVMSLPKTGPNLELCIKKYRDFRLEALETNPGVLAGSFEIEQNLPDSYFADLMLHPRRHIFVAVVEAPNSQSTNDEVLIKGDWVGIVHVQGPIPLSEWTFPNIGGLHSDEEEARWRIFNAYIAPNHRGRMSEQMEHVYHGFCVDETRRLLTSNTQRTLFVRQQLAISPKARKLVKLYIKGGWSEAGYITGEHSLKVKGLGYTYADDKEVHDQPDHLVMERITRIEVTPSGDESKVQSSL